MIDKETKKRIAELQEENQSLRAKMRNQSFRIGALEEITGKQFQTTGERDIEIQALKLELKEYKDTFLKLAHGIVSAKLSHEPEYAYKALNDDLYSLYEELNNEKSIYDQ